MTDDSTTKIPVLVADDEAAVRNMLKTALERAGFDCRVAASGKEALTLLEQRPAEVIITDIRMPEMDGIELLYRVKEKFDSDVMVITGFTEKFNYEDVVSAGAADFIPKPVGLKELVIRLKRVLREREIKKERDRINEALSHIVEKLKHTVDELEKAHKDLEDAYLDTINRLVIAAEFKDEDTGDHIVRMSRYSTLLAERAGLSASTVKLIRYASPMHDIGKIGIPDNILLKQGKLTKEEFEMVKTHTTIGASILENAKADVLKMAYEIALTHHERWDGSGYPHGLKGTDIPISGRIVGLADTFDALTSARPYKPPYPMDVAIKIISNDSGTKFDPAIVEIFLDNIDRIREIKEEINGPESVNLHDFVWSERDRAEGIDKAVGM